MRVPLPLQPLIDYGIIDDVVRPLMSGKEAQIYLVHTAGTQRVAKLYKDASQRSFQNRANYTEGRGVRNSRDRRAMSKRSRHGRAQDEEAWRSTEVDVIYKLRHAGIRVPEPYNYSDGVLVMELVADADGYPAPRLSDAELTADQARLVFDELLSAVVRMLCAGVVHGDLSEFNVLLGNDGPVIIDFPQAVDPATNRNARRLLLRDVENVKRFLDRFVPGAGRGSYGEEMWELYEESRLTPETKLAGRTRRRASEKTDTREVLGLIRSAERDRQRQEVRTGGGDRNHNHGGRRGGQRAAPAVQVAVKTAGGRWITTEPGRSTSASPSTGPARNSGPKPSAARSPSHERGSTSNADATSETIASKRRRPRRRGRRPQAAPRS